MNGLLEREKTRKMKDLKVVVAEQNFILREKLANILSRNEHVGAVFQVADPETLVQVIACSAPDIVVADIGAAKGLDRVIAGFRATLPHTRVCIYSDFMCSEDQENIVREAAMGMGADHFIDVVDVLRVIKEIINEAAVGKSNRGVL